MRLVVILGMVFCFLLLIVFLSYKSYVNKIIRKQEKEIARLQTELQRERRREHLEVIRDGRNPKFGGF